MKMEWNREHESKCGRFYITPQYNHGTRPWSYILHDNITRQSWHVYTIREGKAGAARILTREARPFGDELDAFQAALRKAIEKN